MTDGNITVITAITDGGGAVDTYSIPGTWANENAVRRLKPPMINGYNTAKILLVDTADTV